MKIENYREANPADKYVAIFDIYLGEQWGLTFHNWKLLKNKKGGYFIAGPSFSVSDDMGGKKWFPFIEFTPEKKQSFDSKVLELLKPFMRT
jgi:hypothetical protein